LATVDRSSFPDYFSASADSYVRYRPRYPETLYQALISRVSARDRCWDCATGNGQAALALASYFDTVVATDASQEQLDQAPEHPRVAYRCERAEQTSLDDTSVDLVTVAAALHWLDLPAFYSEVRRVTKPGALIAAWTYNTDIRISPAINAIIATYATKVLKPFWLPQLEHVVTGYRNLWFPFDPIELPKIFISVDWNLPQLLGALNTWSAASLYAKHHRHPATNPILAQLTAAWAADGSPAVARPVRLPLFFRAGHVNPAS